MKQIQYVFCNKNGQVTTMRVPCDQINDDDKLLQIAEPHNLTGDDKVNFDGIISGGASLSNWHVIEVQ